MVSLDVLDTAVRVRRLAVDAVAGDRQVTVTFYGFSILEESMNGTVFPAFQDTWREASGEHVEFISSFAGSGTVTNQLIMGVLAQLALLSLELDAQRLADKGLVSRESWESLPHGGIVNRTPMVILVRKGNPEEHPTSLIWRARESG